MRGKLQVKISRSIYIFGALILFLVPLRWLIALLTAIAVHELSHFLTVRILGGNISQITIDIRGIRMDADLLSDGKRLTAILSGPILGFLPSFMGYRFPELAVCCWVLTIYNLLPLADLDGGNAMRILIKNNMIISWVEGVTKIMLIFGGIYCTLILRFDITPCLIASVMCFRVRKKPCQEWFCKVQ